MFEIKCVFIFCHLYSTHWEAVSFFFTDQFKEFFMSEMNPLIQNFSLFSWSHFWSLKEYLKEKCINITFLIE